MSRRSPYNEGFLLVTVSVVLAILAALAFAAAREGAMGLESVSSASDGDRARYVAEAGLAHARWRANQAGCSGYALPPTPFRGHSYSALFTPSAGSPVRIDATGTLANGVSRALIRSVPVYDPATRVTVTLQPGATDGKDASITSNQMDRNFGSHPALRADSMWRSLVEFDLTALPSTAHVVSATLELRVISVTGSGSVGVHRVSAPWVEGSCSSASCPADGVTWATWDGAQPWATPGADHDPIPIASRTIASSGVTATWDVTPVVEPWVRGAVANQGFLLKAVGANVDFASSDDAGSTSWPRLTIVYECECGVSCLPSSDLLLVVPNPTLLSDQDLTKKSWIEGWGYRVTLLDESATQETYDAAVAAADVVYISEEVNSSEVNTKLRDAAIGIVSEEAYLNDEFALSQGRAEYTGSQIEIVDNTHYMTSPFSLGLLSITDSSQRLQTVSGDEAPGLETAALAPGGGRGTLVWVAEGGTLLGGGAAAGRRVLLPWGANNFDIHSLNEDGRTLMRRAIEWGALGDAAGGGTAETLTAVADNRLDEGSATNHGESVDLGIGELASGLRERSVLRFDLGSIPLGATVHAAKLRLNAKRRETGYADYLLSLGPEAYWRLGEKSGLVAEDLSGNGHHGSYENGVVLDQPGASVDSDSAVDLDGNDDFVDADKFDVVGSGVTLMAWVRFASFGDDTRILSKANGTNEQDHWWMLSERSERLRLRVKAGGTTETLVADSGNLATDTWYFAVGTYDGTTMRLYLDGVQVGSTSHTGPVDQNANVRVAIGANPLGGADSERNHHGRIDEAAVFDYALTPEQIETLYAFWSGGGFDMGAHRVTEDWTELGSNWDTTDGSSSWSGGPGGSYDPIPIDTRPAQGAGPYVWTVTALVQEWVDGVSPNHGFELVAPGLLDGSRLVFDSREGAVAPELEVVFSGP